MRSVADVEIELGTGPAHLSPGFTDTRDGHAHLHRDRAIRPTQCLRLCRKRLLRPCHVERRLSGSSVKCVGTAQHARAWVVCGAKGALFLQHDPVPVTAVDRAFRQDPGKMAVLEVPREGGSAVRVCRTPQDRSFQPSRDSLDQIGQVVEVDVAVAHVEDVDGVAWRLAGARCDRQQCEDCRNGDGSQSMETHTCSPFPRLRSGLRLCRVNWAPAAFVPRRSC